MKAALQFDLPEEREEHRAALDGWKWKSVAEQMDNYLRNRMTYEDLTDEQDAAFDAAREELRRLTDHYEVYF